MRSAPYWNSNRWISSLLSPELHAAMCRLILACRARQDDRVLEAILLIARAQTLACHGHQGMILEYIALRQ
jgi:hypothetical protein